MRPLFVLIVAAALVASAPGPTFASPQAPQLPAQAPQPPAQTPQAPAQDPQQPAPPPPLPAFRSGVEMVSVTVTATDGAGRYVTDLADNEFEVYEDGVRQDVSFFAKTTLPLSVSLLIDTSASMDERMDTVQTAATGFVRQLRHEDDAQLIDFNSRVNVAVPFTGDEAVLEKGIRATAAGGSTALYNAVYIALKELKKSQAHASTELRRQAIVLLSDGEDTSSLVSFDEVLELVKRSETAIYAIGLKSKDVPTGKGFQEADFVLRQLTTQTGGRAFFPMSVEELPAIYQQISDELSSQYSFGYLSRNPKRDGRWRRVVVRVTRPGVAARTKQGYYGPSV